jgi:RHS repeat-associated protein
MEKSKCFKGNQRLAIIDSAGVHYNFSDHLNSSSVTTDANGHITNLIDYYPYGTDRVNVQSSLYANSHKFTDQEKDNESGLYYFDARYFSPELGKFIQSDPMALYLVNEQQLKNKLGKELWEILSNPIALNAYAYANGNPVIYVDPNGEGANLFFFLPEDTQVAIGNWAENLYNNSSVARYAMDHPYQTGAVAGLVGGGIVVGGAALAGVPLTCGAICPTVTGIIGGLGFNVAKEYNKLDEATNGAYETAESGGRHANIIQNVEKLKMTSQQIQKSVDSLQKIAIKHLNYISNPKTYERYEEFKSMSKDNQLKTLLYWGKEALNYMEQSKVYQGILDRIN